MNITRYPEQFGSYRYRLRVEFTDQDGEFIHGTLVFVMFNPATIREESNLTAGSHTRRRCLKFAKGQGYKAPPPGVSGPGALPPTWRRWSASRHCPRRANSYHRSPGFLSFRKPSNNVVKYGYKSLGTNEIIQIKDPSQPNTKYKFNGIIGTQGIPLRRRRRNLTTWKTKPLFPGPRRLKPDGSPECWGGYRETHPNYGQTDPPQGETFVAISSEQGPWNSRPTIAATPRSRTPSATSSTASV